MRILPAFRATAAALLVAVLSLLLAAGPGRSQSDRGIGGTGVVPEVQEDDRGIGGTGVIGTIRGFGSILVNGLEIAYPATAVVRIDGRPGTTADLRVGQVVRVVATLVGGTFATREIDVTSEVVGPVESVAPGSIEVMGQTVLTRGLPAAARLRKGDRVAVSGMRRMDGRIVASLIERWDDGPTLVAGRVTRQPDGSLGIGRLRLEGVNPALIGRRAILNGRYRAGVLEVTAAAAERDLFGPDVRRFSIEAYVESRGSGLRLGSGLEVAGTARSGGLPRTLAVITAVTDGAGRLILRSIQGEEALWRRGALGRDGSPPPGTAAGTTPVQQQRLEAGVTTPGGGPGAGVSAGAGVEAGGVSASGSVNGGVSAGGGLGGGTSVGASVGGVSAGGLSVGGRLGH